MDLTAAIGGFDPNLALRLAIAALLGALVGLERGRAGKPAGARTHGMVSLGAALFAIISLHGFGMVGDPGRVAAQVASGIGFLGAGVILRQRGSVQGLTTAASLWGTAAIGLAAGVGMGLLAATAVLLIMLLLRFGPKADGQEIERAPAAVGEPQADPD